MDASRTEYVVEARQCQPDDMDRLVRSLADKSAFILQRKNVEDARPSYTYIALAADELTQQEADRLTARELLPTLRIDDGAREDFALLPFHGGVFCYLPYESSLRIPAHFWLIRRLLVLDHAAGVTYLVHLLGAGSTGGLEREQQKAELDVLLAGKDIPAECDASPVVSDWVADTTFEDYRGRLKAIQDAIARGELRQAILSIGLSKVTTVGAPAIFEQLRTTRASPHTFLVNLGGASLLGSSPAMHLRKTGDLISVETDAGTRRVGATEIETRQIEAQLLASAKDLEEQRMLVEETAGDLASIAIRGRVETPVDLEVRRVGEVMHLYTVLEARLEPKVSPLAAVMACFPAAAVTGSPRAAAMAAIRRIELGARGFYGGVVGLLGFDGSVDTAIILRSAWVEGGRVTMRCGGGITASSDATEEFDECLNKARAMMACVAAAEVQ